MLSRFFIDRPIFAAVISVFFVLAGLAAIQAGARQPLPPALRAEARGILARFIEAQLGRRLKSVDFLRSVGVD